MTNLLHRLSYTYGAPLPSMCAVFHVMFSIGPDSTITLDRSVSTIHIIFLPYAIV